MTPKTAKWSLQDAKAQFSEVVRRSLKSGPQVVTRNGHDAVVIVSATEYARSVPPAGAQSFAQFLAESPLADVTLDVDRPRDSGRDVSI